MGCVRFCDVGEAGPAFEGDVFFVFFETNEPPAISASLFVFLGAVAFGVSVSMHGDFVGESILVISDPRKWVVRGGVFSWFFVFGPPPTTVIAVDDGGDDEGPWAIAIIINAMLDEGGEVLVAGDVNGVCFLDETEGVVASSLRPAVGVHVGVEAIGELAVNVGASAKSGLGENCFHGYVFGVVRPFFEKEKLAFSEEFESRDIYDVGIVFGVTDVVGARAFHGMTAGGSGFEFSVFKDGEVYSA